MQWAEHALSRAPDNAVDGREIRKERRREVEPAKADKTDIDGKGEGTLPIRTSPKTEA